MECLFTTSIHCEVYKPAVGKVFYDGRLGVPHAADPEMKAEMGWLYTVASPLSPYVLGGRLWQMLVDIADGRNLSDVFEAELDFNTNTVSVYQKVSQWDEAEKEHEAQVRDGVR